MAAGKKTTKSNKTAHVLNLLTAPGEEKETAPAPEAAQSAPAPQPDAPAPAQSRPLTPPILEVARTNDNQISEQIRDALEGELSAALMAELEPEPAPAPAAPSGEKMSQEDIERLLAGGIPEEPKPEPAPAPAPAAPSGGKMSQEDIERLLAGGIPEEPKPEPAPAPAPAAPSGGKMSQEEIERLLAGGIPEEPKPEPEPAPAPAPAAPSGEKMSQEDIERLLAGGIPEEPKAEPAPVERNGLPATTTELNRDAVANLVASISAEAQNATPPAPKAEPAPSAGGKMSQEEIEKLLLGGLTEEASKPAPAPAHKAEPTPPSAPPKPARPDPEEEIRVNVMEVLVEEKAPRYIKMFGLCDCPRCVEDVKALTLTNLVPKYVVLKRKEISAMGSVYGGRYSSTVFAQLTRSCKVVMDNPRHKK